MMDLHFNQRLATGYHSGSQISSFTITYNPNWAGIIDISDK
jgi:hypothetical protein